VGTPTDKAGLTPLKRRVIRWPRALQEVQDRLLGHVDVEHSTFQLEPAGHGAHEDGTH
jgi:hypothetical protein